MNCTMRMIRTVLMMVGTALMASQAWASEVTDVSFTDQGETLRFVVNTDGSPAEPSVFTTDQPPRIVLELNDTTSAVPSGTTSVGVGAVESYMAISAGSRMRLMIDLNRPVGYEVSTVGDSIVLDVQSGGGMSAPAASAAMASNAGGTNAVQNIDFRRGAEGQSRVIVDMTDPGLDITVDERAGQLRINMFGARLPSDLMQRLDVADFATPVQVITPEVRGDNVRLNLDIAGPYNHLAYQSGGQLVIEVERPEAEAEMSRELEFFEEREYTGDRITLNFQDIAVRSVLQLIADISDLNIVVSDSVTGNLTLRLTNVPWDQALDIVLETRNLDMRESGNVRWVAPTAEIAAREQQILTARAQLQELEPLRTVMIPVSYADAVALSELINASASEEGTGLLSERGSVTLDQRTNTLLVTDTAEQIENIRALVAELDRPVRQVLIESRIVVARSNFNHELGVRFGASGGFNVNNNLLSLSGSNEATDRLSNAGLARRQFLGQRPGRPTFVPDAELDDDGTIEIGTEGIAIPTLADRLNVNLPVSSAAGAFGISFLADNLLLDLELSALEAQGEGEVISTPRVIAANQSEAFIQQGVEIPFEEATNAGATSVEFKEAVLELRVTPLITPDNRIQLSLAVKQDTVGEIFETGRGGSVPSIDTRELGTNVLVENGQTIVLGGIYEETRNFNTTKVPVLGDVPVLGSLFRRRATEDQKRELLIFITPNILDERIVID